jgi:hypothetical protein
MKLKLLYEVAPIMAVETCPLCGGKGEQGFTSYSCPNRQCANFDPRLGTGRTLYYADDVSFGIDGLKEISVEEVINFIKSMDEDDKKDWRLSVRKDIRNPIMTIKFSGRWPWTHEHIPPNKIGDFPLVFVKGRLRDYEDLLGMNDGRLDPNVEDELREMLEAMADKRSVRTGDRYSGMP